MTAAPLSSNDTIIRMTQRLLNANENRHSRKAHAHLGAISPSIHTGTHARTHSSLSSKNTIPEVRVLSRRHGEVTQGEALIFLRTGEHTTGVRRCRSAVPRSLRDPASCPPPSASQLIVCSANTLVATRVTLIDERLEFK